MVKKFRNFHGRRFWPNEENCDTLLIMKRVFLAVNLPDYVRREIGSFVEDIRLDPRVHGDDKIVWSKEIGLHITLHFLGSQDEEGIRKINEVTAKAVRSYAPMKIAASGIGFFPDPRFPKVMYVEVGEEGDSLASLREKIGKDLRRAGFEVDHRQWHPHITIAHTDGNLKVSATAAPPPTHFVVDSIDLMQSHLLNSGSEYELIKKHPLAKSLRS